MTPQALLDHSDRGTLWPRPFGDPLDLDMPAAYRSAMAVRQLRIVRGEVPRGYKIGFTNRQIWPRYNVYAPIWGTVWDSTLTFCDGAGAVSLIATCQPRIEPEAVFGMMATPVDNATLEDLFNAIDWVAPGFEVVQSHLPNWKFVAPETVADGALHARLLVGQKQPVRALATNAGQFDALLAAAWVSLLKGEQVVEQGLGANVLGSPLRALHHLLTELRECPSAPELRAGDVVTTGTWTDAWPVAPGEQWSAAFSAPLSPLSVTFG